MTLRRKILSMARAETESAALRAQGRTIGLTNGCFDLLHAGHVEYLQEVASQVDALFVGVNDDASVRALKGPGRPVVSLDDRAEVLAALESVAFVVPFSEQTAERLVLSLRPHLYFKGGDYSEDSAQGKVPPESRFVRSYGGDVRFIPLREGISTSVLITRIRATKMQL